MFSKKAYVKSCVKSIQNYSEKHNQISKKSNTLLPVEGVVVVHDTCLWIEVCDGRIGEGDKGWNTSGMRWMLCWNQTDMKEIRGAISSSAMKRLSELKQMFAKSVMHGTYAKRQCLKQKNINNLRIVYNFYNTIDAQSHKKIVSPRHTPNHVHSDLQNTLPPPKERFFCEVCNIKINIF